MRWGRELEAGRRSAGEALPPTSDNVALLCVIERLTGTDAHGERCRRVLAEGLGPTWGRGGLFGAVSFAYPNDDLFILAAAGDPLALYSPIRGNFLELSVVLLLTAWGLRLWALQVLGLPLRRNPHFLRFLANQNRLHWPGLLSAYVLTPLALWPITWFTLGTQLQVMLGSPLQLLAGTLAAVLLGGVLIAFLSRLISLILLAAGWDLQKTWLDEILGGSAGAVVLYLFGSNLPSIAAFVAFALIPEILLRRRALRDAQAG